MVHQYQLLNQNIVLDTCSGGVYSVDKMAYDMISIFEKYEKNQVVDKIFNDYKSEDIEKKEVEECYDQIQELKDNGVLFSNDNFESMAMDLKAKTSCVVKALCLHVAHTCNLNCEYCFASRLARGLTFSTTTLFYTFTKIARCNNFNMFHNKSSKVNLVDIIA